MADKQNLAKESQLALKQDILIPGQNITIAADGRTISATGGNTVTITPTIMGGTQIATYTVNGDPGTLYTPAVNVTQILQSGTEIARISVGGVSTSIYSMNGNLYGTTDPASNIGDNGSLYIKYDGTTGEILAIYGKVLDTWQLIQAGGGLNLPDNWDLDEDALTAMALNNDLNELGWVCDNDTYYFDTAASFSLGDRTYTKDNAKPALGGVIGAPDGGTNRSIVLTSTDASATHFSWNSTTYSFTYLGTTWYYCGGNYAYWGSPASGIEIIPDGTLTLEQAAKYLIDISEVRFEDYRFATMKEPASGYLFAGGGEETDLSDATFKVASDGGVYGTEFYKNGHKVNRELTQAEYDALSHAEKNNGTFYYITDGEIAGSGSIMFGTAAPVSSIGNNGSIYLQYDATNSVLIALFGKINNIWMQLPAGGGGSSITVSGTVTS